jgi:hypothetical protein
MASTGHSNFLCSSLSLPLPTIWTEIATDSAQAIGLGERATEVLMTWKGTVSRKAAPSREQNPIN